jgi:4-hydroxy-3-methylbut-2-enyl diphosphate reductase
MNIIIPKHSGFCYGVKRSVKAAYDLAGKGEVYMYGEVLHNPTVIKDLLDIGLKMVHSIEELPNGKDAKVLIRAHGVPVSVMDAIKSRGLTVIDMTCPDVKKIHAHVEDASARGMDVVVCGMQGHPEVEGHLSRVTTQAVLIQNLNEAKKLIPMFSFSTKGVCLVAQTTFNYQVYEKIHTFLADECDNIPLLEPHNTICRATADRQSEVCELAKTADACIIVGGKNSSNVTKLYEIAKEFCSRTQHIESAGQLDIDLYYGAETVIIVGGASTPEDNIREVENKIRELM